MAEYLKALRIEDDGARLAGDPIRFVASTEGIQRDSIDLKLSQWDLEEYRNNPIFLWAHNYDGLPVGRTQANIEENKLALSVWFDQADDFAKQIERKYRDGFLNAVSVGWDTFVKCPSCGGKNYGVVDWFSGRAKRDVICKFCREPIPDDTLPNYDLLEVSGVPVPADPNALMERQQRALRALGKELLDELEPQKGDVIGGMVVESTGSLIDGSYVPEPQEGITPKTAGTWDGTAWNMFDGTRVIPPPGTSEEDDGVITLTFESEEELARKMRTGYVYNLHTGETEFTAAKQENITPVESGQAVWRGVATAMGDLLRVDPDEMDEDERHKIYNDLERLYRRLGKTPPEYMTAAQLAVLSDEEKRGLLLEHEPYESEIVKVGPELLDAVRSVINVATDLETKISRQAEPDVVKDDQIKREEEMAWGLLHALEEYDNE